MGTDDQNCESTVAGLLIEPVWNRNCIAESAFSKSECPLTFNRTSMESKLYIRENNTAKLTGKIILLIEPVWNRNPCMDRSCMRD